MKVVFFVHYFPPLNSTGSRRVESFAKYLVRNGHEIVVVSTRKSLRDGPLTETVPPYVRLYEIDALGRMVQSGGDKEQEVANGAPVTKRIHWTRRLRQRLMSVFGQVLDHRVAFAFGVRAASLDKRVVAELASADVFVSSCPPWPVHLAAMFAQRRFGKPWIADYRDQFSGNHIMNGSWLSDRLELWIDRALLKRATAVTVISGPMQTYYEAMHTLVECIENGYDSEIFDKVRASLPVARGESGKRAAVIRYLGTITRDRIPVHLLAALERLATETTVGKECVKVEFYGDTRLLEDYVNASHPALKGWVEFLPSVPYVKSVEAMLSADALFFIETSDMSSLSSRGVLTTKLFEYLASGRQIIAEIDDVTLAASYIRRASPSHVVSRDVETLVTALRSLGCSDVEMGSNAFVESLARQRKAQEFEQFALKLAQSSSTNH